MKIQFYHLHYVRWIVLSSYTFAFQPTFTSNNLYEVFHFSLEDSWGQDGWEPFCIILRIWWHNPLLVNICLAQCRTAPSPLFPSRPLMSPMTLSDSVFSDDYFVCRSFCAKSFLKRCCSQLRFLWWLLSQELPEKVVKKINNLSTNSHREWITSLTTRTKDGLQGRRQQLGAPRKNCFAPPLITSTTNILPPLPAQGPRGVPKGPRRAPMGPLRGLD